MYLNCFFFFAAFLGAALSQEGPEDAFEATNAAAAATFAMKKVQLALYIANEYRWSAAVTAFAARRQQRRVRLEAWKAFRERAKSFKALSSDGGRGGNVQVRELS